RPDARRARLEGRRGSRPGRGRAGGRRRPASRRDPWRRARGGRPDPRRVARAAAADDRLAGAGRWAPPADRGPDRREPDDRRARVQPAVAQGATPPIPPTSPTPPPVGPTVAPGTAGRGLE